jgi:hypothetical protein
MKVLIKIMKYLINNSINLIHLISKIMIKISKYSLITTMKIIK